MPGWRWVHTPGHTPGHVSLFRFSDRLLIAGDAFVTVRQESLLAVMSQRQQISGPPAYFTPDWETARRSVETLMKLDPEIAATGHGIPMRGPRLRAELRDLVETFNTRAVPAHGRYVGRPALADSSGVISVPPPVTDKVQQLLAAGLLGLAIAGIWAQSRRNRRKAAPARTSSGRSRRRENARARERLV
jgi:glyoxylase-like metal-dependent hydrolase (beta-lactamase superfamily II)